jgi:hypothetical protein
MDTKTIIEQFQDYLSPKLDTYEQALYIYILRHSRLQALDEVTIGFKSARRRMAFGIGEKGKPMSEGTCYEKLHSLQAKGCIKIVGTERDGTRLRLLLPSEIEGLIPDPPVQATLSIEELDFFSHEDNRRAILARESHQCFYCGRTLTTQNYVIEHVISRPQGDNTYRNLVAACRNCNNRKNDVSAEDHLRNLYREGLLSADELKSRLSRLEQLRRGELRPLLGSGAP